MADILDCRVNCTSCRRRASCRWNRRSWCWKSRRISTNCKEKYCRFAAEVIVRLSCKVINASKFEDGSRWLWSHCPNKNVFGYWIGCKFSSLRICYCWLVRVPVEGRFALRLAAWLSTTEVGLWLADFPWYVPDLWLTCDHLVGKVSVIGQPVRPIQPPIPLGSVNE